MTILSHAEFDVECKVSSQHGPGRLNRVLLQARRLTGVHCAEDAAWCLQLLEEAAPLLEELELFAAGLEHLQALARMPRLRRLEITGYVTLLKKSFENDILLEHFVLRRSRS